MTGTRSFDEAYRARQAVRKRGDVPPPEPSVVQTVRPSVEVATAVVAAAVDDEARTVTEAAEAGAALGAAILAARDAIIAKVFQDALAALTVGPTETAPAKKGQTTMNETAEYIAKGGTVWQRIEGAAAARVSKRVGAMTPTEKATAIAAFLATAEGAALYDEYLTEADRVVEQHRRSRLAPPDGSR